MGTLVFFVSEEKHHDNQEINTPIGKVYIRVALYRGGGDPVDWAIRNEHEDETLLNTFTHEARHA